MTADRYALHDWIRKREASRAQYPELEKEYIDTYPLDFGEANPADLWKSNYMNIYVHIPFCKTLCSFCAFNHCLFDLRKAEQYVTALLKEFEVYSSIPYVATSFISTAYFGGGTPTSLTPSHLEGLLQALFQRFHLVEDAEVTVEAHPLTVDEERLRTLRENRVNRISVGIQSLKDNLLRSVHLPQKVADNIHAVSLARRMGIPVVNIDLMFRLPGETIKDWEEDLQRALELEPDSISCYGLDIYPGTPLSRVSPRQPNEKVAIEMYHRAIQVLRANGYIQYTKSDFALPGKECKYILNAWKAPQSEVIGFGAGAFSYMVKDYIYCNVADVQEYIEQLCKERLPVLMGKRITAREKMSKYLVLGVRCLSIDTQKFKELFGFEVDEVHGEAIRDLESKGLIGITKASIDLTETGKAYVDNVAKAFYTRENENKHRPLGIELQKVFPQRYCSLEEIRRSFISS